MVNKFKEEINLLQQQQQKQDLKQGEGVFHIDVIESLSP